MTNNPPIDALEPELPMPEVIYAGRSMDTRNTEDGSPNPDFLWLSYEQVPEGYPPYTQYVRHDLAAIQSLPDRIEKIESLERPSFQFAIHERYIAGWNAALEKCLEILNDKSE